MPVEAMHAHFTSHVYHRHSHESYSFGVTETGAQGFTCRHGRHVSGRGMVMAFNPDDPHDGHSAGDGGFTYRMVHIWPEFFTLLTEMPLPLFRSPVIEDPAVAASVCALHVALTGPTTELERYERLTETATLLARHASARIPARGPTPFAARGGAPGPDRRIAVRIRELLQDGAADDRRRPDRRRPGRGRRMQPVRGLPRLHPGLRTRAQRLPAPTPSAHGAQAAHRRRPAGPSRGRGRIRRPGAPDPMVPALLRGHPGCLPGRGPGSSLASS